MQRVGCRSLNNRLAASVAANRFGLGARPGDLSRIQADPRAWLLAQLTTGYSPPPEVASLPSSKRVLQSVYEYQQDRRGLDQRAKGDPDFDLAIARKELGSLRKLTAPYYVQQVAARCRTAVTTEDAFRERLVHFWSNHFAVSADKRLVVGLAGALENEAVRPNLGGRFVDLLLAVEKHPAMIGYLDNQASTGPDSQLARRRRGKGRKLNINENLAREILELHTLGVDGGYTQQDVTSFAHVLSGWSISRGGRAGGEAGTFHFVEQLHQPGSKSLLGKTYKDDGLGQGEAVLRDLAGHNSTANFIATKLARHFIADDPPASAVKRIAAAFRKSDGDLPTVHAALVNCPEAWAQAFAKFKTPQDFVFSSFRALAYEPKRPRQFLAPFEMLGQRPYTPGSPAGWPDTSASWDGGDALLKRIEWAVAVADKVEGRRRPLEVAEIALDAALGDHTRTAIGRAESPAQGLALLLVSPEFQRR